MSGFAGQAPILVLGIGDTGGGGESVGAAVIEALREYLLPDTIELVVSDTERDDVLALIRDRRKVIVADTMDADSKPGVVLRLGLEDLVVQASPMSHHQVQLVEAFSNARRLGVAPRQMIIFCVTRKPQQTAGQFCGVTPLRIATLVQKVIAELNAQHNG